MIISFLVRFKGKRRHRRPRWSNIRLKRRKLNEGGEGEERERKQGDEESEGRSDSEESVKSEEMPSEDACTHCGLPNHPELVRLQREQDAFWDCLGTEGSFLNEKNKMSKLATKKLFKKPLLYNLCIIFIILYNMTSSPFSGL